MAQAGQAWPIRAWAVPAHKGLDHTSSSSSSRTRSPARPGGPGMAHKGLGRAGPQGLGPHLLFLEDSLPLLPLPSPAAALPPSSTPSAPSSNPPPPDAATVRDQAILSVTAITVAALPSPLPPSDASHLESLAELLLAVADRPNHRPDCLSSAFACESLRELEHTHPLLLSDVVGHLWALAQAEHTHATQSYLLLLAAVVHNIALHGLLSSPSSILSTSTPLVPFSAPQSLFSSSHPNREPSDLNLREILHPSRSGPCQA